MFHFTRVFYDFQITIKILPQTSFYAFINQKKYVFYDVKCIKIPQCVFRCFCPVFFHIQMLWELVLLGEPLVVMAPSPAESSETVLALVR